MVPHLPGRADEALPALAPNAPTQESPSEDAEGSEPCADADDRTGSADAWFAEPPEGFHNELTGFGRLFLLLEGWVTPATLAFLAGEAPATPPGGPADGHAAEARTTLRMQLLPALTD